MTHDPFKLTGPTCLSFSGGRTSAYMLWMVLQSNTPEDIERWLIVIFCNTGKEEEATLRFVRMVGEAWRVTIIYLEYVAGAQFRVTDFDGASRNGEPFEAVIAQRAQFTGPLPNPRSRYCSSELKTRTMKRYLRGIGWTEWDSFVGIRADEPRRAAKFRANPNPDGGHETVRVPLVDLGTTAHDVGVFWAAQAFDLELPNNNGKTMHGNCDLCFLKPAAQIQALIAEKPSRAVWWAAREVEAAARLPPLFEPIYELEDLSDEEYEKALAEWTAKGIAIVGQLDIAWCTTDAERRDAINSAVAEAGEEPAKQRRRQKVGLDGRPMVRQRPNTGAVFRTDRPTYAAMVAFAANQVDMFDPDEEAISCLCGD